MNGDFKDYPKSLDEVRANKAKNGAKWTPRDALISLLRDIDNGVDIDMLIVGYRCQDENDKKNDTYTYLYHQATPNLLTALGLLDMTKELIKRHGT